MVSSGQQINTKPLNTQNDIPTSTNIGRKRGFFIAWVLLIGLLVYSLLSKKNVLHVRGPMNTGHSQLKCYDCHKPAEGTVRQQVQANVRHWLFMRKKGASFGYLPVNSKDCLDCHSRDNDRHSIYRFEEMRFNHTRKKLKPQNCVSCHREHRGKRATVSINFCSSCHQNLSVKNDPLDVSHAQLIQFRRWNTCLGCHDYHGNHVMKTATKLKNAYSAATIKSYLDGKIGLYSKLLHFKAKKKRTQKSLSVTP